MLRWLVNNAGLMVLSLILGAVTWMVFSLQEDPIDEFTLPAKVIRKNEEALKNTLVTGDIPSTIVMRVRTSRSQISAQRELPGFVEIDFKELGVGQHVLSLKPTVNVVPFDLVSYSPQSATIKIEPLLQIKVPVVLSVFGSPATGFQVAPSSIEPREVTITGTQQTLDKVKTAIAEMSVAGARSTVDASAIRVTLRDAAGDVIIGLKPAPESVSAKVPIEQLRNYRDLPIVPRWRGQPAEGYAIQDISVDPLVVTVFGSNSTVQATKGFIETQEVVINNLQNDIDERVGLNVPAGVSLVTETQQTVRVRIKIVPVLSSRTVKRKPSLTGLAPTLKGVISPTTIDIVLSGPVARLNNLTEDDVRVTLDVNNLGEGVHQIEPKIVKPEGLQAQSVLPATVQVEITPNKR